MIDEHLENIDHRLTKLEQFLPTLATKEELRVAIEALATREDLRLAIEPLATKEDLEAYATKEDLKAYATKDDLLEEGERSRRHMEILTESLRGDIHLIAEHVASALSRRAGS